MVREAIEPLGWECAFANDIAPAKAEMYTTRFGPDHLRVQDIHELMPSDIPSGLDLLTASFPCTDLSLAGNRNGLAGRHSGTIWPFLELVGEIGRADCVPSALLLENVTGLLSSDGGRDLRAICKRIGELGYLIDIVVVNARWFVPQSRPRLFVLAVRPDLLDAAFPPTGHISAIRPRNVHRFQLANRDLPLVELPIPEPKGDTVGTLVSVLNDVPVDDPSWWPQQRVEATLAAMAPLHRTRVEALLDGEQDGVATMFRRVRGGRTVGEVRGDRLAGCLRTPFGGSSVQFLVDCRKGMVSIRPLTGREYARLQGAADFPIETGVRQAWLGFGDAVCVPAVRWLVWHALGFLCNDTPQADRVQLRLCEKKSKYVAVA